MSNHKTQAKVIQIGTRYFYAIMSGKIMTACTLAGAEFFMNDDTEKLNTVIKKIKEKNKNHRVRRIKLWGELTPMEPEYNRIFIAYTYKYRDTHIVGCTEHSGKTFLDDDIIQAHEMGYLMRGTENQLSMLSNGVELKQLSEEEARIYLKNV